MPEGAEVMTSEMKIHLLRPAAGELLVATGEVIKAGRRLTIVKAEVHADGALVAILLGTMVPLVG
jgi:acyl-coenzyme A thioesterase PaaI-like protein